MASASPTSWAADAAPASLPRRAIAATVIGNTLEVFDFIAYGIFAVMIGRVFFPAHDPFLSLLLSVATFGIGFITRPLGAILAGILSDRRGRRAGMVFSLALMGLGSLMIAVLPGYRTLGSVAPALLVLARLVQGVAWGAEAGPATTYLLESAPPNRRGAFAAWQAASQSLAVMIAGLVGAAASHLLGAASMDEWGWRLPFALGVLVVPVGLVLRLGLAEMPEAPPLPVRGMFRVLVQGRATLLLLGLLLLVAGTVSQYFLNYLTTYALTALHLPQGVALAGTVIVGIAGTAAALGAGQLSDRLGRRLIIVVPRLLLAVLIVPLLTLLSAQPTPLLFMVVAAIVAVLQVSGFAASVVLLCELFPPAVRTTGFGTLYAVTISLFGGTAQIVFTALIGWTADPVSPAWYLAAVNLVCAGAGWALTRTAGRGTSAR